MHGPGDVHWKAAKKTLRYISGTINNGITLGGDLVLKGYCDAPHATAMEDRQSVMGYVLMLGVGPVAWQSHKSKSVHLSSSESEFYSLSEIAQELTWFKSLMIDLPINFYPVVVDEDNANVINWIKYKASRARTKILDSRLNYAREAEAFGLIKL